MTQTKAELLQTRHQGDIRLGDADSTHYVGFKAPATVGTSLVWTLPAADGTANYLLKTDGSGNLGWVADSSTDSTKMPLAGGTFTGDVTFSGDNYNVVWDKSDDRFEFADNAAITFGSSADSSIVHDGSNFTLTNVTGEIRIRPKVGEEGIIAKTDGAVELYHDNVKKIETYSNGINVSGRIQFTDVSLTDVIEVPDGKKITVGSGGDCSFYHDGSDSYISDQGTGNLNILSSKAQILNAAGNEAMAKFTADGAVELYYDNTVRFSTNASGVEVHGNLQIDDSNIAKFGTGGDLEIYHDGSNSYIKDAGTGGIYIDTSFLHVRQGSAESMINAIADGAVELYYDNVKKIETTAQAVKITGGIAQVVTAAAALELDLNTSNYFTKTISGNSTFTFANPAASGQVTAFTLELTHSSGTVTWPSSVKWNADTAPTLTTGKTHLFMFVTDDGGSRYRGSALVDYVN
jgi:hypothetical protein